MSNPAPDLDPVFHALADTTRRQVLMRLCHGSASVSELAEPFDMALPSFIQHLKVLEQSGLVQSSKIGRSRIYQMEAEKLQEAQGWLEQQYARWERRLDQLDSYLLKMKEKTNE